MTSTLYIGDCRDHMRAMAPASIDAIVTDPPYALEFMGRDWDRHESPRSFQAWCESWAVEALRVLKPGGYLLSFGGTRTHHRMICGLEDAGFEIRDCLVWLHGSGFPKSLDVSKAIDRAAGVERTIIGYRDRIGREGRSYAAAFDGKLYGKQTPPLPGVPISDAATDAARAWAGWGTALKPGWEPITVARKPFRTTVAVNVLQHGTGAINIDGCRLETGSRRFAYGELKGSEHNGQTDIGRWPPNVILDESASEPALEVIS